MTPLAFTSRYAILTCLLLASSFLLAQSITEQMHAINTNFIITSKDMILNRGQQAIVLRPVAVSEIHGYNEAAYGYAYQSYHLEFQSSQDIIPKSRVKGVSNNTYEVNLYDAAGEFLATIPLSYNRVKTVSRETVSPAYQGEKAGGRVKVFNGKVINVESAVPEEMLDVDYTFMINLIDIPYTLLDQTHRFDIIYYGER